MAPGYRPWPLAALLVVVLAGVLFFWDLGGMPLTDRDEGEYAASVAAMERTGNYIVPTLNGQHYLEKPILIFWAIAAGEELAGPNETGARLPSAISAFALTLMVGCLVFLISRSLAWATLSAAAFAFTPLTVLVGRACLTDMLLTLFTTGALACFFVATERPDRGDGPWYLIAWACLGLSFLTKGPVGPAVVLPAALVYIIWQRRFMAVLKRARIHWGVLIFLVVNLPWYGLAFYLLGEEFWRAFFVSQNLRRFSEVLLGHGGGFFYYLPVVFMGVFPFCGAGLAGLGQAWFANPRPLREAYPAARLRLFAGICAVVVLVVFSIAATKQINYILPAFPFLAVLAGHFLWHLGEGQPAGRIAGPVFLWGLAVAGTIWAVILAVIPVGLPMFWEQIEASIRPDSSEYALPLTAPVLVLWSALGAVAAAGAVLAGFRLRRARPIWQGPVLACAGFLFSAILLLGLLPQAGTVLQAPAKEMALAVRARDFNSAQVATYGLWKPSLFFYLNRDIERVRVPEKDKLAGLLAQEAPVVIFSRVRLEPELGAVAGYVPFKAYEGYQLGGNQAAQLIWEGQAGPAPENRQ